MSEPSGLREFVEGHPMFVGMTTAQRSRFNALTPRERLIFVVAFHAGAPEGEPTLRAVNKAMDFCLAVAFDVTREQFSMEYPLIVNKVLCDIPVAPGAGGGDVSHN